MSIDAKTDTLKTAEEYCNQGLAFWHEGKYEEAAPFLEKAYEMAPDNPAIILNYSLTFMHKNDYAEAEKYLRKAIEKKPDYAEAYDNLGYILYNQHKVSDAIPYFLQAIKLKPNVAKPMRRLGSCYTNLNDFTQAIFWLEKAIKLDPKNAPTLNNLGTALHMAGYEQESIEKYFEAIDVQPDLFTAYYNILSMLEQTHKMDDLHRLLKTAEENIPGTQTLAIIKARLAKRDKNYEEAIKNLEAVKDQESAIRPDLFFELGMLYDRINEPDKAFPILQKANDLRLQDHKSQSMNIDYFPAMINELMETCTKERVRNWSPTYPSEKHKTPHFLVGYPRSGTTLTGQILDSHPELFVAEEIKALEMLRTYMISQYKGLYPNCIDTLGVGDIEKMRSIYYANHRNNPLWEEGKTLIDKHPLNVLRANFIHRVFPEAKIIFVARHPCDCIFSSFMQNFGINEAMLQMTSLRRAVDLYKLVHKGWNQYREAMPDMQTYTIRYEDLIENFNDEIAKMLDFLELEWDDSVLEYNKNAQSKPRTNTPSYAQVTEPIYKRAANRWEKYRKYFEPYLDELRPCIEELGYEA